MQKTLGRMLVMVGICLPIVSAQVQTPEIDPSFGVSALVLLAGAAVVVRGRFKK